jgi:hypothetical protein
MSWLPSALQLHVVGVLAAGSTRPGGRRPPGSGCVQVVVDRVVEDVHLVEAGEEGVPGEGVGPRRQLGVALEDLSAPVGIAQGLDALGQREAGDPP